MLNDWRFWSFLILGAFLVMLGAVSLIIWALEAAFPRRPMGH